MLTPLSDPFVLTPDNSDDPLLEPIILTPDTSGDYTPAWSPDGQRIVFVSERDGNAELYVMNADGSNLIRLTYTAAAEQSPDWTP
ncbi:MAG: PD40 domain-containing protein [Chloroflexi bacterium]|nr:PD40 domain-containing protein [Chloroflexota bacterium]